MRILVALSSFFLTSSSDSSQERAECRKEESGLWYRQQGRVLIAQPNLGLEGGGSYTLHQIHDILVTEGVRSAMCLVNPQFASTWSVNMSFGELVGIVEEGLDPHDVLLVPEIAEFSDEFGFRAQRHGGLILRYIMGMHRQFDRLDPRLLHVCISKFTRRQLFGCVGPVLGPPPLANEIYQAAALHDHTMQKQTNPILVLIDDDSALLENLSDFQARLNAFSNSTIAIRLFKGYNRQETIDLFKAATVFVDSYHPGMERALWEAAHFGVVPLVARLIHGTSAEDLPGKAITRYEHGHDLAAAITDLALTSVAKLRPHLSLLNEKSRKWPINFRDSLFSIIDSRHFDIHLVWTKLESELDTWILPLFISMLCLAPLAALVVYIDPKVLPSAEQDRHEFDYWLRMHLGPAAFDLLKHLGLISRLRIRYINLNQEPTIDPLARSTTILLPPNSLLIRSPVDLLATIRGDASRTQDQHFTIVYYQSDARESPVAILSNEPYRVHEAIYHAARGWRNITSAPLAAESIYLSKSILLKYASSVVAFENEVEKASSTLSSLPVALKEHPLWQSFFPLFHSNVRRLLASQRREEDEES